jgi:nucleoside-diphosphate-sugar epimerase
MIVDQKSGLVEVASGICEIDAPFTLPVQDLASVANEARSAFESLDGKHIFITGGTGFLGGWIVECLSYARSMFDLDIQVTMLIKSGWDSYHFGELPGIHLVDGDIASLSWTELNGQLERDGLSANFDAVIHGAVLVNDGDKPASPLTIWDSVVTGSRNVLDVARHSNSSRLLLLSSGAVYGSSERFGTISESCPTGPNALDPNMAYAEGKRAMEAIAAMYLREYGLNSVIARCFSFFGPRLPMDSHLAAAQFVRDALAGGPIRVNGDGSPIRGYLYAADMAAWLITILAAGRAGVAYNVGSENECSIRELATLIGESARVPVEIGGVESRPGIGDHYVPDTSLIRNEFGLSEQVSMSDSVERTLAWFRAQREAP